ncbi:MAG: DNA topoisomerase [Hominisplanchenecus sp.]|uniref:DNA topoisomerase n=1 Tax=Hominisplanchenecus sp. TaxID=3038130 RepID=UPI00399B9A44
MNLVDAQQARRVLDRMVGIPDQSASLGKSQTRLKRRPCTVCGTCGSSVDREEEINAFIPEEYWTLDATFKMSR